MIKIALKNIPSDLRDDMLQRFSLFSSLLDGNSDIYILSAATSVAELSNKIKNHPHVILGFASVSKTPEYHVLEAIEVPRDHRGHNYSRNILDDIFYECSQEEKPLMLTELSALGRKALMDSLELFAVKYGVYVMNEKDYEEMREEPVPILSMSLAEH